jgi:hypothetical protein
VNELAARLLATAAVVLAAACAGRGGRTAFPAASTGGCRWPVAPVVLRQAADTVEQSWTYEAGQLPERVTLSRLPALSSFLDTVRARVGTSGCGRPRSGGACKGAEGKGRTAMSPPTSNPRMSFPLETAP